jgi:DNA mismatch repair protein MutL
VQEQTDYLNITGFVGKPETAKKTRGDQYFFVNNRFIKSAYLNHAVMNAFAEMIPRDSYPMYALFIDLDPAQLDINVHPTKQEIKFEDEKIVYAFVQSAVKHALAQFSITPTLDFELDPGIEKLSAVSRGFDEESKKQATSSSLYQSFSKKNQAHFIENKSELRHWKDLYEKKEEPVQPAGDDALGPDPDFKPLGYALANAGIDQNFQSYVQLHNAFILVADDNGFLLLQQQNAHERILYERFLLALDGKPIATQQSLFPVTLELSTADVTLLQELMPELKMLGYYLEPFGNNTFVIQGTPANVQHGNEKDAIENMLEQFKHFSNDLKFSKKEKLLRSMALQQSIKSGTTLAKKEMEQIVSDLFACQTPNSTPNGKPTYMTFKKNDLEKMFGR